MENDDGLIQVKIDENWQRRLKYAQAKKRFSTDPYISIRIIKYRYYRQEWKKEFVDLIYFTNLSHEEFD